MMKYLTALLILFSELVSAGDFHLTVSGQPVARILLESTNGEDVSEQIRLFNSCLRKITGTELPVGNNQLPNVIRIAIRSTTRLEEVYDWEISFPRHGEMRIESGKYGLFNALNALLEKAADCRFLGIENCMFQYEPKNTLSLPVQSFRSPAGFSFYRGSWLIPNHRAELGLGGNPYFHFKHGIPVFAFPAEKYKKEWPAVIMPVQKGKKLKRPKQLFYYWQPCYSNPETAGIAASNILEKLKRKPELSITLAVNDNFGYCECADCIKMDRGTPKSIFSNDKQNHSASYYTFVNRVAEAVCRVHPRLKIGVLAYFDTITPPPFPVHENVVPMLTLDTVQGAIDPEVKKNHYAMIGEWGKKVPVIGIWEYCWGRNFLIPRVNFAHQAETLKYLYAHGGRAYFMENSQIADALDGPKTYITSRLLKDPSLKLDDILNEWYERFSGPDAAPYLRELYHRCELYWTSEEMKKSPAFRTCRYVYAYPTPLHLFSLQPEFSFGLVKLAEQVRKHARTDQEKQRAELLLRHFEQVDSRVSFQGWAYTASESGEFYTPQNALGYFSMLQRDWGRLTAQHQRAIKYFSHADVLKKYSNYCAMKLVEPDPAVLLADGFLKALAFIDVPDVAAEAEKTCSLPGMPGSIRKIADSMRNGVNVLAGKKWSQLDVRSGIPFAADSETACKGKGTIRLFPAAPGIKPDSEFVIVETAPAGRWAVSLKLFTASKTGKADLCLWASRKGKSDNWEEMRQILIPTGRWQPFSRTCKVQGKNDSVNIILRFSGFKPGESVHVGGIRLVRIE